jgi:dihydroxyacetone kinase-like protein
VASKEELTAEEVVALFQAGVEGVVQRGRPQRGDKTMYDAWAPALDAMQESLARGGDIPTLLRAGVAAAARGVEDTIPMQARKGRASYLGERSMGHQDPGATSSLLMLAALLDIAQDAPA